MNHRSYLLTLTFMVCAMLQWLHEKTLGNSLTFIAVTLLTMWNSQDHSR